MLPQARTFCVCAKREAAMATIKTESIQPGKHLRGVTVNLHVQTSAGRFTFPFDIEDQGSSAANETQAHRELRTFLQEALHALGDS
jgi:hypothetical protein